jgi:hypothetical protein
MSWIIRLIAPLTFVFVLAFEPAPTQDIFQQQAPCNPALQTCD